MTNTRIPVSTYRLQFNKNFTFAQATELVPYLAALGISHCYASPYLRARPGSTHGYDIIDHNKLNPEIGSEEEFEKFVAALHQHGMGQILDIVPNHMGVMGSDNAWWLDVLENGEASDYAGFFDIDWQPLKDELQGKILVPILGDQYGNVLDNGELKLVFDKEKGELSIFYNKHRFPVNPREYPRILNRGLDRLEQEPDLKREDFLEFQSVSAAFGHLPSRYDSAPGQREERLRDKEIHKRRLATLCSQSPQITAFVERNVLEMNGVPGDSKSFDEFHELIKAQAYRLAYWRVAADDINYRRFFDINDLAGLRMENEAVFELTHRFVLELLRTRKIDGLRIDHPDGLYDPAQYFRRLQAGLKDETHEDESPEDEEETHAESADGKPAYVIIEKILSGDERLPPEWPIHGTTGYDFLNLVNGLFVAPDAVGKMDRIYRAFVGTRVNFDNLVYRSKKIVMHTALASELNVLGNALSRIALSNRHTCDFTLNSLQEALSKIVACFPVYRTYISGTQVSETDRAYIEEAVECAKRQSPGADFSVFDFVRDTLLINRADSQGSIYRRNVIAFAMKAQQFTSAVMAKGLEDTSFYRYHRLDSLNEVGGDPRHFGVPVETFHRQMMERQKSWPHTLLDTTTHDTKRSEDVRSRIDALSEIPMPWARNVRRWREFNHGKKVLVDDVLAPSRNDEYLLYQTLVGAWPLDAQETSGQSFCRRIQQYMIKAVRESKEKSSWANPNTQYESAMSEFVERILTPSNENEFLQSFLAFHHLVAQAGMLNSLSQTLLKLTCPGVPDLYQGTELWDLSLVDPDNRRPVDYARRQQILQEFNGWNPQPGPAQKNAVAEMTADMRDGRIKMFITWKALNFRKQHAELFQLGRYHPLTVTGPRANHLVAFARCHQGSQVVVVVPRLCATLLAECGGRFPRESEFWKDTRVEASPGPPRKFENVFTSEPVGAALKVSDLFEDFPVGLLAPFAAP